MNVLVVGSTGCIGHAVAQALRARGHRVVAGARSLADGSHTMHVDYAQPIEPAAWAERLRDARIEVVVNAVGILIESRPRLRRFGARRVESFERVHAQGPIELFRGAALAGVRRVVQVSALGVGPDAIDVPYLATKLRADDALAASGIEYAIVRPSLVHGPGSDSSRLFATLASLPVIGLPGRGRQRVQPIHVYEVAEAIARLIESNAPVRGVFELAGPVPITYREMLAAYRASLALGDALWLPVPMPLMKLGAWFAEALPQRVFARDTLRLLERGNVAPDNAAPALLKRAPTGLSEGLRVTPPRPMLDLHVELSPAVAVILRASIAFMWLYTALVTALLPDASGVLRLLARCGFDGTLGMAVMAASCVLNTALGIAILRRPGAWAYATQIGAVLGYTATAAINMPELTIDHCGPLVKNLPLLALLTTLWCARTPRGDAAPEPKTRAARRDRGPAVRARGASARAGVCPPAVVRKVDQFVDRAGIAVERALGEFRAARRGSSRVIQSDLIGARGAYAHPDQLGLRSRVFLADIRSRLRPVGYTEKRRDADGFDGRYGAAVDELVDVVRFAGTQTGDERFVIPIPRAARQFRQLGQLVHFALVCRRAVGKLRATRRRERGRRQGESGDAGSEDEKAPGANHRFASISTMTTISTISTISAAPPRATQSAYAKRFRTVIGSIMFS